MTRNLQSGLSFHSLDFDMICRDLVFVHERWWFYPESSGFEITCVCGVGNIFVQLILSSLILHHINFCYFELVRVGDAPGQWKMDNGYGKELGHHNMGQRGVRGGCSRFSLWHEVIATGMF